MLERLDQIDWRRLTHAYGDARDVPKLLRKIATSSSRVRLNAIDTLEGSICHQGSRYRASAPAVPFLFELLGARGDIPRTRLIDLLVSLAIGYSEDHLPFGFDPAKEFAEVEKPGRRKDLDEVRASEPNEEEYFNPALDALWAKDAYDAVQDGISVFVRLARSRDQAVSRAAIKALAWFPETTLESLPVVRRIAFGRRSPLDRSNAILCLGILGRYQKNDSDVPALRKLLERKKPAVIRSVAAISLAVLLGKDLPDDALDALLATIQRETEDSLEQASWHVFGMVAQTADVLASIRPKASEHVLSVLCEAAESVDTAARASIWYALLKIVFPNRRRARGDLNPGKLTQKQVRAVEAIERNPLWRQTDSLYDHHQDVILHFGLPIFRKDFRRFVKAARGE